jgi:hypothetical protein
MDTTSAGDARSTELLDRFWTILGLWTLYGVFNVIVVHYRSMLYGKPMSWVDCALYEVTYVWIWAAVTPLVLLLSRRFPLGQGQARRNGLVHLAGALAAAVLTKTAWDFTALPFVEPSNVPMDWASFQKSVIRALDFSVLHYTILIVCHHAVEYYRKYEDGRLRASQLEARLATAQLQALKMQLHPHFLFNTLHSISELVHADPKRAESMIMRLSDFLRLTLEHVGVPEVPLAEEIDFLRRYLEIEQMRYEERLTVEWQIDAATLGVRVPNLILQPIVENALKHGISRNTSAGVLRISTRQEDGKLAMKVVDNGPGPQRTSGNLLEPVREGVGLNNTRSRLERLYGGDHHIDFRRGSEGGFEVTIRIPMRPVPGLPAPLPAEDRPEALRTAGD